MCVRVSGETVDKVGDRSVLFVDTSYTFGLYNNAFESEVDVEDETDYPVDFGGACGKFQLFCSHLTKLYPLIMLTFAS